MEWKSQRRKATWIFLCKQFKIQPRMKLKIDRPIEQPSGKTGLKSQSKLQNFCIWHKARKWNSCRKFVSEKVAHNYLNYSSLMFHNPWENKRFSKLFRWGIESKHWSKIGWTLPIVFHKYWLSLVNWLLVFICTIFYCFSISLWFPNVKQFLVSQ